MVVGTLNQLSIVPEVQVFFGDRGWGRTRRIKSVLSLVYYAMFRFLRYSKKYIIYWVRDLVCIQGKKYLLIVVCTHMDYLFPTEIKKFVFFSLL